MSITFCFWRYLGLETCRPLLLRGTDPIYMKNKLHYWHVFLFSLKIDVCLAIPSVYHDLFTVLQVTCYTALQCETNEVYHESGYCTHPSQTNNDTEQDAKMKIWEGSLLRTCFWDVASCRQKGCHILTSTKTIFIASDELDNCISFIRGMIEDVTCSILMDEPDLWRSKESMVVDGGQTWTVDEPWPTQYPFCSAMQEKINLDTIISAKQETIWAISYCSSPLTSTEGGGGWVRLGMVFSSTGSSCDTVRDMPNRQR